MKYPAPVVKKHARAVQIAVLHARNGNIQSARQLLMSEYRAAMSAAAQQYIKESLTALEEVYA